MQVVNKPRIGLISDSDLHRHIIQSVLAEQGYQLAISVKAENLENYFNNVSADDSIKQANNELDAWLIDLVVVDAERIVDTLVENSDLPMLINDEIPLVQEKLEHEVWQRRLIEKIEIVAEKRQTVQESATPAANTVWVLAASLGGPAAVKRFLHTLPAGLALAMVYAQHIEINFDEVLANSMGKHAYPMEVLRSSQRLLPETVTVVPADRQLRFLPFGQVVATNKPWTGMYQPAIDQVISDLARVYRQKLGVIVFSGLCNDGEIGCRVAKACGATIWVQDPHSCQSPEMVNAALSTGCVSFQGSPEQLALALAERYNVPEKNHA